MLILEREEVMPKKWDTFNHIERFTIEMDYVTNWDEPQWKARLRKITRQNSRVLKTAPIEIPRQEIVDCLFEIVDNHLTVGLKIDLERTGDRGIEIITYADSHDELRSYTEAVKTRLAELAEANNTETPVLSHCFDMVC